MTDIIYKEPKAYVYLGYHPTTDKIYVGARWANVKLNRTAEQDFGKKYKTSSKEVKPIFNEIEWEIVFEGTDDEVEKLEDEMIEMYLKSGVLYNHHSTKKWNRRGKTHTDATKSQFSKIHKGQIPWNKGVKTNKPAWNSGKTDIYSEETLNKMREARFGIIPWNVGEIPKKNICPYCNKSIDYRNYTRWHGENCKHKLL